MTHIRLLNIKWPIRPAVMKHTPLNLKNYVVCLATTHFVESEPAQLSFVINCADLASLLQMS